MSQFFGRFALTAGKTTTVQGLPTDGIGAIVVSNDSAYSVVASPEGAGQSLNIPAGVADVLVISPRRGFTGNLSLLASAQLTIQNSPSNQVEINIYGAGENVPGVYPLSLNRLSNTGNDVGTQGPFSLETTASMNNNSMSIPGQPIAPNQTCYLKGFELTGSSATAKAKGQFTITGFDANVDPAGLGLTYEIEVYTGGPMLKIIEWFQTPIPGAEGSHINFACPSISDAVIALNAFYYLI
jgi:hypothetical protein